MRNFIKQTFASLIGSLLGLFIFFGVSTTTLLLLIFAAASSKDLGPVVKDSSMLVFDLSTEITDGEPSSSIVLQETLSGNYKERITLRDLLNTLKKAQKDKRIVGIYIDATNTEGIAGAGFATLKEIRQELTNFQASGKKIIAYSRGWGEREYYLSSVADNIMLDPFGAMEINGLSSQPLFLKGALEKYGIGVQIVRVGKFKGAVEPFVLTKLSPENRQQTQKLLDDVWSEWRTTVGKSRKLSPQQLQAIADNQAVLAADKAKTSRLVDKVAYFDEVIADLKKLTKSNEDQTFRQINLTEYAEPGKNDPKKSTSENQIAVVYADGEIVDGKGENGQVGGDRFAKIFRKLRQDEDVKSIVLRINSPGGSATASEVIQREIRLTRRTKPVVVSMGDVAASGGYWIAVDSNRIFAEPNTITGSIGVFGMLLNAQKLANDNGITWDAVKTGRYADTQTLSRPKSPEELALYQSSVNRIYNVFLEKVAQGRKLSEQKVAEIAQGRVWSGRSAQEIGLVDEIGGLDAAIAYAAKQANLGKDWQVQEYPRADSFGLPIFGKVAEEVRTAFGATQPNLQGSKPLMAELQKLQDELSLLQNMNDPLGVYARLPFNLKIE